MRQLIVSVPRGHGARALELAREAGGVNLSCSHATGAEGTARDVALVHLANARVGAYVDALEELPELHVTLLPAGVLPMRPPAREVAEHVTDVTALSPLEIHLGGVQSIGSWTGFLAYAVAAGVVVWLGLYTSSIILLVGAMLIAPYAGPAMVSALGTARGDWPLLWRSLARYGAALLVTAAVAALLSLAVGQQYASEQMIAATTVSATAFLLPLAAGGAGALHLSQGERSSLVSGAGTGILIAASLAPPAGVVGMSLVADRPELLRPALFLLALQLAGINLAGAAVFHLVGLRPRGERYARGRPPVAIAAAAVTALLLGGLVALQFTTANPALQRASLAERARNAIERALEGDEAVSLVEASARFTRSRIEGQHTLLVNLVVQPRDTVARSAAGDAATRARVTGLARDAARRAVPAATPLVDLSVLPGP